MASRGRPLVLGIETSCDETACAVVDGARRVHAEVLFSQLEEHAPYGGVVPEIAARAHAQRLDGVVRRALDQAGVGWAELDAIAVTCGPGLAGALLVGVVTARTLARVCGLRLIPVNHLEAHALTARLSDEVPFPYLLLLVSGGHTQLLAVEGVGHYRRLGTTVDDAVGEAFDKVAKMLGLGYPGGPAVEQAAQAGDPDRFALPRPFFGQPHCDFSFSGLKTAVRQHILRDPQGARDAAFIRDLCAGFQRAVVEVLCERSERALACWPAHGEPPRALVVAGGVAANQAIRQAFAELAARHGLRLVLPPLAWCGDNATMVAWAGIERLAAGLVDGEEALVRPRWPLAEREA